MCSRRNRSPEATRGAHNPSGHAPRGAWPIGLWLPRGSFQLHFIFVIFLRYQKRHKLFLWNFWSRFTYHTTYLPLFSGFWSVPEDFLDVFFQCDDLDDICFFINGCTWNIMLNSLPIHHSWVLSFEVVDFYSTGAINLLNNVWAFPFGEEFSCKKN